MMRFSTMRLKKVLCDRKFAPHLAAVYEGKFGGAARRARFESEVPGCWSLCASKLGWF